MKMEEIEERIIAGDYSIVPLSYNSFEIYNLNGEKEILTEHRFLALFIIAEYQYRGEIPKYGRHIITRWFYDLALKDNLFEFFGSYPIRFRSFKFAVWWLITRKYAEFQKGKSIRLTAKGRAIALKISEWRDKYNESGRYG